jgi:hypothetical protein
MSTGNKPSQVTFSALIDGHPKGLAHVPEKGQDSVNDVCAGLTALWIKVREPMSACNPFFVIVFLLIYFLHKANTSWSLARGMCKVPLFKLIWMPKHVGIFEGDNVFEFERIKPKEFDKFFVILK